MRKILLAFSLLVLVGVAGAHAYPACACSCLSSCTTSCVGPSGLTNCGALGTCVDSVGCGGGGCLTAGGVDSLLEKILSQTTVVPVGGEEGRAASRLTWRLTQHVEEGHLGEVYTAGTGFLLSDGLGKLRAPQLAFVSQERVQKGGHGTFRRGAPDLVAQFLVSPNDAADARRDAQIWLKAGTRAVLVVDSTARTVSVYRGAKAPEKAGQGAVLDLSDVVAGWNLRVDDLFE